MRYSLVRHLMSTKKRVFVVSLVGSNIIKENIQKQLHFIKKILKSFKKILSSNHLDWATSYNNIGLMYGKMGDHSKALSSHEKILEVYQKSFPLNHLDLINSYYSIGVVYHNYFCLKVLKKNLDFIKKRNCK